MKKLLVILAMMIIIQTALLSNSLSNADKNQANFYLSQFQAIHINYNGVSGFFVPTSGWAKLTNFIDSYIFMENVIAIRNNEAKELQGYSRKLFRFRTAFGISLIISIAELFLYPVVAIIAYNL